MKPNMLRSFQLLVDQRIRALFNRSKPDHQPDAPFIANKLTTNASILGFKYGQVISMEQCRPLDAQMQSIPWFTYPCLEYLSRIDVSTFSIFEYGIGESTSYWSQRALIVHGVEHSEEWFHQIQNRRLPNVSLNLENDKILYTTSILQHSMRYDIVVIDGIYRECCIDSAVAALNPSGFIIFDNSDWYHVAAKMLRERGFLEVSFSGFGPVNDYTWSTSIFFPLPKNDKFNLLQSFPIGGVVLDESQENTPLW